MHYFSPWDGDRPGQKHGRFASSRGRSGNLPTTRSGRKRYRTAEMGQTGLTKTQADDLLDWLEAHGCRHYEVTSAAGYGFAVRWWN